MRRLTKHQLGQARRIAIDILRFERYAKFEEERCRPLKADWWMEAAADMARDLDDLGKAVAL